jgi:hypothetical protein
MLPAAAEGLAAPRAVEAVMGTLSKLSTRPLAALAWLAA